MASKPGALSRFAEWARRMMAAEAAQYVEFLDSGVCCEPKHVKKALRLISWSDPRQKESIARLTEALCVDFFGRAGAREALEEGAARVFFRMPSARREAWREELARANPRPGQWAEALALAIGPAAVAAEAQEIERSIERSIGAACAKAGPKARPRL